MMMLETIAVRPKKMVIILLCLFDADEGRGEMYVALVADSRLVFGDMTFSQDFVCVPMCYVGKD